MRRIRTSTYQQIRLVRAALVGRDAVLTSFARVLRSHTHALRWLVTDTRALHRRALEQQTQLERHGQHLKRQQAALDVAIARIYDLEQLLLASPPPVVPSPRAMPPVLRLLTATQMITGAVPRPAADAPEFNPSDLEWVGRD